MENSKNFRPDPELRLMDQVRQVLRYHHYAYRTEQTYCDWIMRYIRYHGRKTHPREMGKKEIEAFLSHLTVQQKVAASTQRQALNAIVFLYKKVLDIPVDEKLEPVRAKRHRRPPVVMAQSEVANVLGQGRSGVDGSCRCEDDRALYPRNGKGYFCCPEPSGRA